MNAENHLSVKKTNNEREMRLWEEFRSTGSIEDYLRFSREREKAFIEKDAPTR